MFEVNAELSSWIKLEKTAEVFFDKGEFMAQKGASMISAPQTPSWSIPESGQSSYSSGIFGAQWLQSVQQRIVASSLPTGYAADDDGRWISQPVAAAAISFLGRISSNFTTEPYLYSSPSGDLVAEFEDSGSKLAFIISPDSVTMFSVIGNKPVVKKRPARFWSASQIRFLRKKIFTSPQGKKNGAVAP